jgi:hypothetical protein
VGIVHEPIEDGVGNSRVADEDCEAWSHHRDGGWRAINIAENGMTTRLGSKAEFGRIFGTAAAAAAALHGGG